MSHPVKTSTLLIGFIPETEENGLCKLLLLFRTLRKGWNGSGGRRVCQ